MDTSELLDELVIQWYEAKERGEIVSPAELCQGRPQLQPWLERRIRGLLQMDELEANLGAKEPRGTLGPYRVEVGTEIEGFRLLAFLGSGGYSDVWKATRASCN